MELKGSKTEKNLLEAFAGESMARNKYTFYAEAARKDGYQQVAELFEETALNEYEHAKLWFTLVNGGELNGTDANLKDAAEGENYEWTEMYKNFADEAREEGFDKIAFLFDTVAKIENRHEKRYLKLLDNVEQEKVFAKDQPVFWQCMRCGFVCESEKPVKCCPVCKKPQEYFQILSENY